MRNAALPAEINSSFDFLFGERRRLDAQVAPLEDGLPAAVEQALQAGNAHLGLDNGL